MGSHLFIDLTSLGRNTMGLGLFFELVSLEAIRDSRLCRLRSDGFSLNNHVPLDDGTHLITMKPTGFYSRVNT